MSTAAALSNGLNLAYWLYRIHPDLFNTLATKARQARSSAGRLSRLSSYAGLSDITDAPAIDQEVLDSIDATNTIDPELVSLPDPQLSDVAIAAPGIDSEVSASIAAASSGTPSSPSSSALGTVGAFLGSVTGLTALAGLAASALKAGSPQQATVQTQVARAQAGAPPAPITYGYNSSGQLVPILKTAGTTTPLTPASLFSLIPSGVSGWLLPAGLGLLLLAAFSRKRK